MALPGAATSRHIRRGCCLQLPVIADTWRASVAPKTEKVTLALRDSENMPPRSVGATENRKPKTEN